MKRRDIILTKALAVNKSTPRSLIGDNVAKELIEPDPTSQNQETKQEIENNPSVESYISLDPPSYSPITPHDFNRDDTKVVHSNWLHHPSVTPDMNLHDVPNGTVQYLSGNSLQNVEDSPVRPMSPATLDMLNTILDSSNDSDSVKDPDFVIIPESSDTSDTDDSQSVLVRRNGTNDQNSTEVSNNIDRSIEDENCIPNNDVDESVTAQQATTGRPKKGRKRKFEEYTLAERKSRKYANLPYRGRNKEVNVKVYRNFECNCKNLCHIKINEEEREKEFNKFVNLGSYEAQLLYICSNVTENPKKRSYVSNNNKSGLKKSRTFSRTYKIADSSVCRNMFLKTFQITTQKVTISLKKNRTGKLHDCRGISSGGWNKTSEEEINFVCNMINRLPKYESHYRRSQIGDAKYLKPGLTLQKIYDLYVEEYKKANGDDKKVLSLAIFRKIFLTRFNLKFKTLKKDTCNKCDTFAAKLKSMAESEEKKCLLLEKERHLLMAETLRSKMNSHIERAKVDNTFECITYDMEKTLPLPRIPTNVVFYKRQLWFYNCGIHVSSTNQGYCFVWIEGEAGRGAQEVGSCLMKFINQIMKPDIEYLSLWSDSCGGQNRNIKMVLLLKVVLAAHPTLKTIEGHRGKTCNVTKTMN